MIETGGYPLIWHQMKGFSHWDLNDFVIVLGYKRHFIKQYFMMYPQLQADLHVGLAVGQVNTLKQSEAKKCLCLHSAIRSADN